MSLFSQLKRDMRSLVQGLLGDKSAPAEQRGAGKAAASGKPIARHGGRVLSVRDVVRETDDAVSLVLADPSGAPIPFVAGQFFTLVLVVGGKEIKRAYSASSPAQSSDEVRVTIKEVPGGQASPHIVRRLAAGAELEVLGPSGAFTVEPGTRRLVLLGGGSGITPLMSITRTLLAAGGGEKIDLVYGNRSEKDIIFRADLDALAAEHPERFRVRYVLEEASPVASRVGRLDRATVEAELDAIGAWEGGAHFFLCGPLAMMDEAKAAILARGVEPARVKEERFVSLADPSGEAEATDTQEVTVRINGRERLVFVRPGQTILEAGLDEGLEMPNSCTVGGCGTCRVKLVSGQVSMAEPNCLDPDERSQGYILACCSKPLGPCAIEVE
jgi:ferredoxin-NADP reductase